MKYLKKFNEDFAMLDNEEQMEGIDSPKECEKCGNPHDFCDCETAPHIHIEEEVCFNCGHEHCVCDDEETLESISKFNEKKKLNAGLQAYLDKKAGKKSVKSEDKSDKKDCEKSDKKDCKKSDKKDEKEVKGSNELTAAQKKLPAGLQKAILAKKKK